MADDVTWTDTAGITYTAKRYDGGWRVSSTGPVAGSPYQTLTDAAIELFYLQLHP